MSATMDLKTDGEMLAHVRTTPAARIVHLFPVAPESYDDQVLAILGRHGRVRGMKRVFLWPNGQVNLKKITYRGEPWLDDRGNDPFHGAKKNARGAMGRGVVRVFVYDCPELDEALKAKAEARGLFGIGKFPMHINDRHAEAVEVAEMYFNANSVAVENLRPYKLRTPDFDAKVEHLKAYLAEHGIDPEEVCVGGSGAFGALGIRRVHDLDLLHLVEPLPPDPAGIVSSHDGQLKYYPFPKEAVIRDPALHFYYRGVKFATPTVAFGLKLRRHEWPKDWRDAFRYLSFRAARAAVNRCAYLRMRLTAKRIAPGGAAR